MPIRHVEVYSIFHAPEFLSPYEYQGTKDGISETVDKNQQYCRVCAYCLHYSLSNRIHPGTSGAFAVDRDGGGEVEWR